MDQTNTASASVTNLTRVVGLNKQRKHTIANDPGTQHLTDTEQRPAILMLDNCRNETAIHIVERCLFLTIETVLLLVVGPSYRFQVLRTT